MTKQATSRAQFKMYLLKALTGNELKVFMIICYHSDGRFYTALDEMMQFKLTYPTIIKSVDVLCAKSIIRKVQEPGKPAIIELLDPYDKLAEYLKTCQVKLKPKRAPIQDPTMGEAHKTIVQIIAHYGQEQGIPTEHMREWQRQNIGKLYNAARKLYGYTHNLADAMKVITKAKAYFQANGLPWTLEGAILNNIHIFLPFIAKDGDPAAKIKEPIMMVVSAYKLLKGIPYDDRRWDDRHMVRARPHAQHLLNFFGGEWRKAAEYMEHEANSLKEKNLEFNIATLADRADERGGKFL